MPERKKNEGILFAVLWPARIEQNVNDTNVVQAGSAQINCRT